MTPVENSRNSLLWMNSIVRLVTQPACTKLFSDCHGIIRMMCNCLAHRALFIPILFVSKHDLPLSRGVFIFASLSQDFLIYDVRGSLIRQLLSVYTMLSPNEFNKFMQKSFDIHVSGKYGNVHFVSQIT